MAPSRDATVTVAMHRVSVPLGQRKVACRVCLRRRQLDKVWSPPGAGLDNWQVPGGWGNSRGCGKLALARLASTGHPSSRKRLTSQKRPC